MTGIAILGSCAVAKQVPYFQDILSDSTLAIIPEPVPIRLEPEDKISILVNSRDPQLMMLFNLPVIQRYVGSDNPSLSSNSYLTGYTIDGEGNIDFPVLGKIHLARTLQHRQGQGHYLRCTQHGRRPDHIRS